MIILNLTQHPATPEQKKAGVVDWADTVNSYINWAGKNSGDPADIESRFPDSLNKLLTFDELPDKTELILRAQAIADYAFELGARHAMIGGAPYFMEPLHLALTTVGICPVYAFSKRESVEEIQDDGTVKKITRFKHIGFVGLK